MFLNCERQETLMVKCVFFLSWRETVSTAHRNTTAEGEQKFLQFWYNYLHIYLKQFGDLEGFIYKRFDHF